MGLGVQAQWEAMAVAGPYSPRTSLGSYSSSFPARPSYGCRTAEATEYPQGLQHWLHGPLTGARGSGSSPVGCFTQQFPHVHLCQALCWALRTLQCSRADLALPSWGYSQVGEPDNESCDREAESRHCPGLESRTSSWKR